ncbi:MAG TPA: hypothetical protein PKY58_03055 [Syntrophales bacterium]|nr:hypothetical protein [Syntrophales bacterium]HPX11162.1 hypothetical protein [Syntrophales bacterium]HQN78718.1 hypothetical protein [Syntrophales bacterium]HQQ26479.1 hypothetical protein [Syntrophales bacterium]
MASVFLRWAPDRRGNRFPRRHSALGDSLATAMILQRVLARLEKGEEEKQGCQGRGLPGGRSGTGGPMKKGNPVSRRVAFRRFRPFVAVWVT